jgi:hypothetical protein
LKGTKNTFSSSKKASSPITWLRSRKAAPLLCGPRDNSLHTVYYWTATVSSQPILIFKRSRRRRESIVSQVHAGFVGLWHQRIARSGQDITDLEAYINVKAALRCLLSIGDIRARGGVVIAGDLRPSTDRIMRACAQAMALSDDIDKNRDCPEQLRMSTSLRSFFSKSSNIRQTLPSDSEYHYVQTKEGWHVHLHRARSGPGGYPTAI